jgi:hypothetical protein
MVKDKYAPVFQWKTSIYPGENNSGIVSYIKIECLIPLRPIRCVVHDNCVEFSLYSLSVIYVTFLLVKIKYITGTLQFARTCH